MAEPSQSNSQPPVDAGGFLHSDALGDSPLLPEAGHDQGQRLASMQSALDERMAAVEDACRRSAAETQHALEAHRNDLSLQLGRQRFLSFLSIWLIILLTLAIVGYLQWRLQELQTPLGDGLTELPEAMTAPESASPLEAAEPIDAGEVERLGARAAALEAQVGAIRDRLAGALVELTELQGKVESPAAPEPPDAPASSTDRPDARGAADATPSPSATDNGSIDELVDSVRAQTSAHDEERSAGSTPSRTPSLQADADSGAGPVEEPVAQSDEGTGAEREAAAGPVVAAEPDAGADPAREAEPDTAAEEASGTAASEPEQAEPVGAIGQPSTPRMIRIGERPIALQLIGFRNRDLVDAFIARNPLPAEVYAREETFRGRPWFVLIHSLHPDSASAREASDALPRALGSLDLWIRELPAGSELEVIETAGNSP